MDRGQPLGVILWAGEADTLSFRLLAAGASARVEACALESPGASAPMAEMSIAHPAAVKALEELVDGRPNDCIGIAVPPGLAALRVAALGDGLAKAVGWADSQPLPVDYRAPTVFLLGLAAWSRRYVRSLESSMSTFQR